MSGQRTLRWFDPIPLVLSVVVLLGAGALGLELRQRALPVSFAEPTRVEAGAVPIVLGREQLGQRASAHSAARRHLRVDRQSEHWVIANAADDRRVFVRTQSGDGFYLHRWPLQTRDRIVLPGAELEVLDASDRLELRDRDTGRTAVFETALEAIDEDMHPVCTSRTRRVAAALRWRFRGFAGDEISLFSIGGNVNCSRRWSLPKLAPQAIRIHWRDGRFEVAPGESRGDVIFARGDAQAVPFAARTLRVDGDDPIVRLILGRTVYSVTTSPEAFTLEPVAYRDLWRDELPEVPMTQVAWAGDGAGPSTWALGQALWMIPGALIAIALLVAALLRLRARRDVAEITPVGTAVGVAISAFGGWITLLTQRGEAADALLLYEMLIASLAYATIVLSVRGRLFGIGGLVWACATLLALVGSLVLLLLGSGAENSQWMRYFDKHALLLALFGWSIAALGALPAPDLRYVWVRLFGAEWVAAGAGGLLVLGMGAQLTLGTEAGIAGLQPVELTKSVYVVLLAFAGMHLLEVRRRDTREYRRSPVAALLPFLRIIGAFALVVLSVVVGVRDFSPGIILGLVTMLWLFRVGRPVVDERKGFGMWKVLRPAAVLLLIGVVSAAAWARANPDKLPAGMPQRDRVLVWSQPELHPHSGSQVLAAMERVGRGGMSGARMWFGPNEDVMAIPAVQDDFITAFFLNRFGGFAGLTLVALQLLYLTTLFILARRIEEATRRSDFREQNAGRVLGFSLFGLAWMHVVHWSIAWCNTLGLLPVMGQPMTWMSAGNSHLLGFALLSLTIALATSWVLRDIEAEA